MNPSPNSPNSTPRPAPAWLPVAVLLLAVLGLAVGIHRAFRGNTPGIDFYVYYQAGRAFLLEGIDPYGAAVSGRVQQAIYGRPALPGEDPMHFANPAYSLLLVGPWLALPFDWAQAAWMAFNLAACAGLLLRGFPAAPRWALWLTPFFYPVVFGLLLGNFAVLVFSGLAFAFGLLNRPQPPGRLAALVLGLLLACLTVKPQSSWLFLAILLALAYRRRAYPVLWGFAGGLLALLAVSLLVQPGWPLHWLERLQQYGGYSNYQPSRVFFLGLALPTEVVPAAGWAAAALLGLAALLAGVRWARGRLALPAALSWCGLCMYFVHPNSLSYEHLILLLPVLVWAAGERRLGAGFVVFWVGSWAFTYAVLLATWRWDVLWPVSHLPLVAYVAWMAWLHLHWLPRQSRATLPPLVPVSRQE